MLALPLKKGNSPPETGILLKSFVESQLGLESQSNDMLELENDIKGFTKARDAAISVTESSADTGMNCLTFMITQLLNMAPRLAEYQTEMRLSFLWVDAFKPAKKITSTNLYYELAGFLWNYAALCSHTGSRVDRTIEEGVKTANKQFQLAAGNTYQILLHVSSFD